MLFLRGAYVVVFFGANVDGVDVDGRIGRCFACHKTVRNAPLNGVKANLNGPVPIYAGIHGHFLVRQRLSPPAPPKQGSAGDRLSPYG